MDFVTVIVVPSDAALGAVSIYHILGHKEVREGLEEGHEKPPGESFRPLAKYVYAPLAVIVFILRIVRGGIE